MAASPHYRIIIVDDEELARRIVREHVEGDPESEIVAECANGFDAVKEITELRPDIVFLDIQMPKLTGFEVLELVDHTFATVFVTAHDEHALKAFDVHAVDYLLKPFSAERFTNAFERAKGMVRGGSAPTETSRAQKAKPAVRPVDRVLVRDGSKVHILPLARISHVEAQDDYVAFVCDGKRYLKQQAMAEVEAELPSDRFIRIHRSTILNVEHLARIELYAKDSRLAILKDGTKVNISRSGYDRLNAIIGR